MLQNGAKKWSVKYFQLRQEAREIRLLEKEEDRGTDQDRASSDLCIVLELGHLNQEVWKRVRMSENTWKDW